MRTALIRQNPLRLTGRFWDFDRFFESLLDVCPEQEGLARAWTPAIDIEEGEKATVIRADLPGVDLKDIKISVDDGRLILEGERKEEREHTKGKAHWNERFSGAYRRVIALPNPVNVDAIEAKYNDGVLTVTCPFRPEAVPRQIKISRN